VLSFSRALGQELRDRKIYVTAVCPGPVDTPFFDIAERTGGTLAVKKLTIVKAEAVVEQAIKDSYHKREKSVYSGYIRAFEVLAKEIPHRFILEAMRFMPKSK
jgi:hypothetical protein